MTQPAHATPTLLIGNLDSVGLHVSNLDKAVQFYKNLGFDVAEEYHDFSYAVLQGGGMRLALHVPAAGEEGRPIGGATGFTFTVPDINGAFAKLKEQGVQIAEEPEERPWGEVMGSFYDPDGHEILVTEE